MCYSDTLKYKYDEKINSFKNSYMALEINVTPKIHAVFFQIYDFCATIDKGISLFSEQASESVDANFKRPG